MWKRLSEKRLFNKDSSYNNNYHDYDPDSDTDEEPLVTENFRLLPSSSRSNGYAHNNHKSKSKPGPNTNSISFKNNSGTVHYKKNSLVNATPTEESGASGEADSDTEELNRFNFISSTSRGSGNSKMLRGRDRYAPSSVDNPNYQQGGGVINIGPLDSEVQLGASGERNASPTHQNVLSSDEYRRSNLRKRNGIINACCEAARYACCCCFWLAKLISGERELKERDITLGHPLQENFPPNVIKNQKYNIITFIPLVLFQQFKFFLNLYFLVMACSQFFKDLVIGYWYTYWGPLIFVLTITLIRELIDDLRRRQRDKEINNQKYTKIMKGEQHFIPSSRIRVGDLIMVEKDQRVPADMVLLRTSDRGGRCFIRTDQLDGETDWKLRLPILQDCESDLELFSQHVTIYAERPQMDIHAFIGTLMKKSGPDGEVVEEVGINVDNTLWANTVLAAGNAVGLVVYTGRETRSVMNNSMPRSKVGLIDLEINDLTKILFAAVVGLAFLMMCLKGWEGPWFNYMFRFVLLFSYIIPISLRVNMDMAKSYYAYTIQRDQSIVGTVVRSTTIPEDLGRISYLLTDKTGTLTQNEMVFKRLVLATSQADSAEEIKERLKQGLRPEFSQFESHQRVNEITRITEAVKALGVCHNVTPVYDDSELLDDEESTYGIEKEATYQASSPDEIALVKYAKNVGLSLVKRDQSHMTLRAFEIGLNLEYQILQIFPFTSEAKRMGIIVKEINTGEIIFYQKGADVVMRSIVRYNDWLDEACGNMAREGLRTLVVAKKQMSQTEYDEFERKYNLAKSSKLDRANLMYQTMCGIENDMQLLCVTGVEDTLQKDVKITLEMLRNAGIKIWMLTGDKLETATCIAKSSKLVSTQQELYVFKEIADRTQAFNELNSFRRKSDAAMVIKGEALDICLRYFEREFMELATACPVVVVCRCSPTQKAKVVELVQKHTGKRTAACGDGGNDVAMIQSADAGIGLEGKEGRQASLAADFSITQFSFIAPLLLIHGRYSYKRSASLAQFVMHRGLIITVMQAVFSSIFYFSSVALYQGFLMIGYATVYTMLPVFALVLDKDVRAEDLLRLPELYSDLGKGRSLTLKTFFLWVLISVYQGGMLMYGALILFQDEFIHIVSISFTSLIFTELIMVALTIRTMHKLMIFAEVISFLLYLASLVVFHDFFDSDFILSFNYVWKVLLITALSCVPIYVTKFIRNWIAPPNYSKLS